MADPISDQRRQSAALAKIANVIGVPLLDVYAKNPGGLMLACLERFAAMLDAPAGRVWASALAEDADTAPAAVAVEPVTGKIGDGYVHGDADAPKLPTPFAQPVPIAVGEPTKLPAFMSESKYVAPPSE